MTNHFRFGIILFLLFHFGSTWVIEMEETKDIDSVSLTRLTLLNYMNKFVFADKIENTIFSTVAADLNFIIASSLLRVFYRKPYNITLAGGLNTEKITTTTDIDVITRTLTKEIQFMIQHVKKKIIDTSRKLYLPEYFRRSVDLTNFFMESFGIEIEYFNLVNKEKLAQNVNNWFKRHFSYKLKSIKTKKFKHIQSPLLIDTIVFKTTFKFSSIEGITKGRFKCSKWNNGLDEPLVEYYHVRDVFKYFTDGIITVLDVPLNNNMTLTLISWYQDVTSIGKDVKENFADYVIQSRANLKYTEMILTLPKLKIKRLNRLRHPLPDDVLPTQNSNETNLMLEHLSLNVVERISMEVTVDRNLLDIPMPTNKTYLCEYDPEPIKVTIDRSFLFSLHCTISDHLLFIGKYTHPRDYFHQKRKT